MGAPLARAWDLASGFGQWLGPPVNPLCSKAGELSLETSPIAGLRSLKDRSRETARGLMSTALVWMQRL